MFTMEEGLEDVGRKFKVGAVYIATPAIKGQPKKLGAILSRDGATLQVAFVDELVLGQVKHVAGRDFATVRTRSGQYNLSACVKVAAADAAIVNDILKHQGRAVG